MQCLQIIDLSLQGHRALTATAAGGGDGDGGGGGGGGGAGDEREGELRFPDGDLDPVSSPLCSLAADRVSALWLVSHMFEWVFTKNHKKFKRTAKQISNMSCYFGAFM